MRRVVSAVVVVTGVNGGAEWHDARGSVVVVVVTNSKLRGGAKVCVERTGKNQGKVKEVTVEHDAMLQATKATRQARRGADMRSENKRITEITRVGFPVTFVCQFAC